MGPAREEQIMKRTAVVLGIAAALFVAPRAANAGNVTAQVNPQVKARVVATQVVTTQVVAQIVTSQRVVAAVTAQRVDTQRKRAHRLSIHALYR
jgi:hypothetical protein